MVRGCLPEYLSRNTIECCALSPSMCSSPHACMYTDPRKNLCKACSLSWCVSTPTHSVSGTAGVTTSCATFRRFKEISPQRHRSCRTSARPVMPVGRSHQSHDCFHWSISAYPNCKGQVARRVAIRFLLLLWRNNWTCFKTSFARSESRS